MRERRVARGPKVWGLALACAGLVGLVGCDAGDASNPASETSGASAAGEPPSGDAEAHHDASNRHARGLERRVGHLCVELGCSDEQREALMAELASLRRGAPEREGRDERRASLAAAFAADDFDAEVLAELRAEHREGRPSPTQIATSVGNIHELLSPEQRAKVAQGRMMGALVHGPGHKKPGKGMHRRHHGDEGHHARRGRKGPDGRSHPDEGHERAGGASKDAQARHAERRARHIEQLCLEVGCDDEQRDGIEALMEARKPSPELRQAARARHEEHRAQLATLFVADAFDAKAFAEVLEGSRVDREAHHVSRAQWWVGLHELLRPEQRAKLASSIEAGDFPPHRGKRRHPGRR